jgi:hypothetical protein
VIHEGLLGCLCRATVSPPALNPRGSPRAAPTARVDRPADDDTDAIRLDNAKSALYGTQVVLRTARERPKTLLPEVSVRQLLALPLVTLLSLAACAEPPPPVVPQAQALPPPPPPPPTPTPATPPPPPAEKPALPPEYADVVIKVEKVAGNVYMLEGKGGNIGVSVGDDGVVIVDDEFAPLALKIQEALKGITD